MRDAHLAYAKAYLPGCGTAPAIWALTGRNGSKP